MYNKMETGVKVDMKMAEDDLEAAGKVKKYNWGQLSRSTEKLGSNQWLRAQLGPADRQSWVGWVGFSRNKYEDYFWIKSLTNTLQLAI